MSAGELEGRIILVTGASRGIGRAVALEAARRGADIIALARTEGGLEELDDEISALGRSASLVPCDLADSDGLDRLAAVVAERWGRLDGLAAIGAMLGPLSPVSHIEPKHWDEAVAVNVSANWRLLRAFDALLRASDAGRAVFVTSDIAQSSPAFWAPYAATKAGLEALVRSYAHETEKMSVCANLFSPGPVRTAMLAKAMPGADLSEFPAPRDVAPALVDLLSPQETRTGERVAFAP
jgi:NAD(P)-dependent dehydrogenase (short-subunit alcohol dehydrogenase family)